MVVVAIVGGTGSVGRTLVEAFKASSKHEVIVLARKVPQSPTASVFAVDYTNVDSLTKTFEDNKVHTVISTIMMMDETASQAELNLVAAATKARSVKRFMSSHWGVASPEDDAMKAPPNFFREATAAALAKTDLEWTQIHNGLFLDYYGMPHVDTYLNPLHFAVDIPNRFAGVPGTGDEVMSVTSTKDVAKFVVASLDLEKWDTTMRCWGDNVSVNQIIAIAEEMTGDKFTVTYDSVDKLKRGEITELPSNKELYAYFPKHLLEGFMSRLGLWTVLGIGELPTGGSLNDKFPEIKPVKVKEFLEVWKGK